MDRTTPARLALLVVTLALTPAFASKVKVWHQQRPAHFDRAKLTQAVVSSEGTLSLSRKLKPLGGISAAHVWDVVEDKKGNLFVATGGEGKVFKVTPDGKTSVAYAGDDAQVLCLVPGGDGAVYAGTGPSGRVVRIDEKGGRVLHEGLGSYVWSLAADPRGETLYAATGPKGRVYKLTADGKASVFFSAKQDHLLCVAVGPDGEVYAGSDRDGLVYRIDAKGKGFVLHQAPQAEVRSLHAAGGAVYFATSSPSARKRGATTAARDEVTTNFATKRDVVPVAASRDDLSLAADKKVSRNPDKDDKGKPAPAPSSPSSGENSLFRVAADGTVREVFREKALLFGVLPKAGGFLVGTGGGRLFEVDEKTKERTEIARLDHGQILALAHRADGSVVVGTGDPGKLYVLEDKYAATGTVVSEVLDAKIVSKWGSLRWQGETPEGTRLTVAVRGGNVAEPDDTWSDWSVEQADGDKARVTAPNARYLQYRVTLTTEDGTKTPTLRGLAVRYATTNQAPEVTKLEVPNLDAEDLDNPKKVKLKWTAEDANEDALTYSVYVRKDGWKSWVLLDDELEKAEFEWDTTTTPSGVYRVKVVAGDRKDNPADEALSGERVSDAFAVCHTPPVVTLKVVGSEDNQAVVEATGTSELVRLVSGSYSLNGKKWNSVFPSDGLFDGRGESFRFKTDVLKPGTYVVVLRVKDASGNTGSGDVVFTVQTKK